MCWPLERDLCSLARVRAQLLQESLVLHHATGLLGERNMTAGVC